MKSIEQLATELKRDMGGWEEGIFDWACELAQSAAKVLLERIDEELMKEREEGLEEEGLRGHWVTTRFGDVNIRRRLYGTVMVTIASCWTRQWDCGKGAE
jgi:hypothetical protein